MSSRLWSRRQLTVLTAVFTVSCATAKATEFVNLRAGPNNEEAVITVVPAQAPLDVVECNTWCEVVYEGQRGWIYNEYVDRSGTPLFGGNG